MLENYGPPIITLILGFFLRHLLEPLFEKWKIKREQKVILRWLKDNTENKAGLQYLSSFDIAKGTSIQESRVMMLCTIDKNINRIQENGCDMWGLYEWKSVYETRGLTTT